MGEDPTVGEVCPPCMNKPNTGNTVSANLKKEGGKPPEPLLSKAVVSTAGTSRTMDMLSGSGRALIQFLTWEKGTTHIF